MPRAATPLYTTACTGFSISRVQVFPTHITYQRKIGPDISVPSDTIASVEERVYQYLRQLRKAEGGVRGMNTTQASDLAENLA